MTWKASATSVIACSLLAGAALAAGSAHPMTNLDQVKWGSMPASLPPGADFAVVSGDPGKRGIFVVLIRGPQGYKVPPHWHSTDENVTVLSGSFTMGAGDKLDPSAGMALTPGGFAMMPKRMHHWAIASAPFVIQIQAMGPFDIHYINPADDPAKNAKK
jgi:quercetin dioxygenase-like cupin family protein